VEGWRKAGLRAGRTGSGWGGMAGQTRNLALRDPASMEQEGPQGAEKQTEAVSLKEN